MHPPFGCTDRRRGGPVAAFETDPESMTQVAFALSAAADSGPPADLPPVHGSGSTAVDAALAFDGDEFALSWRRQTEAAVELAVGAVTAADAYREAETTVASAAEA